MLFHVFQLSILKYNRLNHLSFKIKVFYLHMTATVQQVNIAHNGTWKVKKSTVQTCVLFWPSLEPSHLKKEYEQRKR